VGVVGKLHPDRVISMLNAKRGMIQTAVAKRVVLRSTPRLVFKLDTSAQRGVDMVNLLDDIEKNLPKAKPSEDEDSEI
jgi:ribosome-binding factor A